MLFAESMARTHIPDGRGAPVSLGAELPCRRYGQRGRADRSWGMDPAMPGALRANQTESFVTNRPICALAVGDGASVTGPVIQIPPGTKVRVCGSFADPRLIDVRWGRARYAIFEIDLREAAGPEFQSSESLGPE